MKKNVLLFSIVLTMMGVLMVFNAPCASTEFIVSSEPFVPHAYETLDSADREKFSQKLYQKSIDWYKQTTDLECFKIQYMSGGLKLIGFMLKQKSIASDQKCSVIIYNRGSCRNSGKVTVMTMQYEIYDFVKNGYVVLAPQYPGNDGGEGNDELGGQADLESVLSLITIAKTLPYVDANNIFMAGLSRGGIMTYQAIANKAPINAAATIAGVADLFLFMDFCPEEKRRVMTALFKEMMAHMPQDRDNQFKKRSATYWAHELNVPLLMIHADGDPIVSIEESKKLAEQLQKYNKKYELVVYHDDDHVLKKFKTEINQKIMAWFEKFKKIEVKGDL